MDEQINQTKSNQTVNRNMCSAGRYQTNCSQTKNEYC